jgi:tellurite methyltransferase
VNIPFWEETYKDDAVSTFGTEPNTIIPEYEHLFEKTWNILEIGCGEGNNSLYLSRRGFLNMYKSSINLTPCPGGGRLLSGLKSLL